MRFDDYRFRSPDVTARDFYLWEYLKAQSFYWSLQNHTDIEELKPRNEIESKLRVHYSTNPNFCIDHKYTKNIFSTLYMYHISYSKLIYICCLWFCSHSNCIHTISRNYYLRLVQLLCRISALKPYNSLKAQFPLKVLLRTESLNLIYDRHCWSYV